MDSKDRNSLLGWVSPIITLMKKGTQFDVRHLFGITSWESFPLERKELIAQTFFDIANKELKESISICQLDDNLFIQRYTKS
ncbi:MAG: hypothetical protein QM203_02155 [Bacillota bacterium]|jgi:hypothetical protein|nr:hypothetical protein [Bacillota bacterium]